MITESEVEWLALHCPNLVVNEGRTEVCGDFALRAAYDDATESFVWLLDPQSTAAGQVLFDTYKILIQRRDDSFELPRLIIDIDDQKKIIDRHFFPNGAACLCGAIEKREFLVTGFSFLEYLERLVVPFIYQQTYYDKFHEWPWGEYAHGPAGVFQSYAKSNKTQNDIAACLYELRRDKTNWSRISAVLSGNERVTETSKCFCLTPKQIRRCHPDAWFAMVKLRSDIRRLQVRINGD